MGFFHHYHSLISISFMPLGQGAGCFELCMIYYCAPLLRYQLRCSYGLTTFAIIIMHAMMIRILHNSTSKHTKKQRDHYIHPLTLSLQNPRLWLLQVRTHKTLLGWEHLSKGSVKKGKPIEKEEKNMTNHHSLSYRLRGNQSLRLKRQEPRILHKKPHPRMLLTQDTTIYLCE